MPPSAYGLLPASSRAPPAPSRAPLSAQPATPAGWMGGWQGRLELRFGATPAGTRLLHNRHEGPLRLLKALRSDDQRRMEAVIVHPPGGLVSGDSLALDLRVGTGARVLATTPGAQKWYRGEGTAQSCARLRVEAGGVLEWLPQPAILYDCARARQTLLIDVDRDAACFGWEVLVRGRAASGEMPKSGHIDQTVAISVAQALLWQERMYADAGDRLFESPLGWDGQRIAASVWCCAPTIEPGRLRTLRDRWRALLAPTGNGEVPMAGHAGATIAADGLLLAKLLADDSERLMSLCRALWRATRLSLEGSEGSLPRIWRT